MGANNWKVLAAKAKARMAKYYRINSPLMYYKEGYVTSQLVLKNRKQVHLVEECKHGTICGVRRQRGSSVIWNTKFGNEVLRDLAKHGLKPCGACLVGTL